MRTVDLPVISKEQAESEPAADRLQFDRKITISATVAHRGRVFTVTAEGYTVDQLADMLDKKFGAPAPANGNGQASTDTPICPTHRKAMKKMTYADSRGNMYWCTQFIDRASGARCDQRA